MYVVGANKGTLNGTTTLTVENPAHESGDFLLACWATTGGASDTVTLSSGWTTVTNQTAGFFKHGYAYLQCSSSSESNLTLTLSASLGVTLIVVNFRGVDSTTPLGVNSNTFGQGQSSSFPVVAGATAGSMIVEFAAMNIYRGGGFFESTIEQIAQDGDNPYCMVGAHTQQVSGSTRGSEWWHTFGSNRYYNHYTIELLDDGNDKTRAQSNTSTNPAQMIHPIGAAMRGGSLGSGQVDPTVLVPSVPASGGETTYYNTVGVGAIPLKTSILPMDTAVLNINTNNDDRLNVVASDLAASQDLSNSVVSLILKGDPIHGAFGKPGIILGLINGSGSGAYVWEIAAGNTRVNPYGGTFPYLLNTSRTETRESYGSPDLTDITSIMIGAYGEKAAAHIQFAWLQKLNTLNIVGGSADFPAAFTDAVRHAYGSNLITFQNQGSQTDSQVYATQSLQFGDGGTTTTPVNLDNSSISYAPAYDQSTLLVNANVDEAEFSCTFKPGSSDSISMRSAVFEMGNYGVWGYESGSATPSSFDDESALVLNATPVLQDIGYAQKISFIGCREITQNGADLSGGGAISNCPDGEAIQVDSKADFEKLQNRAFSNNSRLSIKITGDQSGTWSGAGMTVSGGGTANDIRYLGDTDFTIEFDTGSGWTQSRVDSTGLGTLTITVPTTDITISSSEAGSDIKLFDGGTTQTPTDSTTGQTLSYTYSGSKTWFYTVQKAGYNPVRGSISGNNQDLSVNVTLEAQPAYTGTHGLTYSTDYAYDATTRTLTIVSAQEGRDLYSSLIDEWITRSDFYNREFPISPVGPDRFDFTSDKVTAATIDSGDIQYWRGAGMEWQHATSGNATHKFCSIKGVGTNPATVKGFYQYAAGSGTTELSLVNNNVDQVIQFYSDPDGDGSTADGYDRSTHLVIKLFDEGYYQARSDVLASFGISNLEAFEYTVNLQTLEAAYSSGDQGITITTLTDHTSSPIDPGSTGDAFSFELVDPGANSAAALAAQVNHDIYTDPTATLYGLTAFNWPDIIIESGGSYETKNGVVESESAGLGFYVSRSSSDHPDFLRFESDTAGDYYTPIVVSSAAVTGMQNDASATRTLLHIFNKTAAASSAWQASTAQSVGDRVLRTSGLGSENTGGLWFRCSTAGTTGSTEPTWNTTVGGTTADGSAVWTCYNALQYQDDPASATYSDTYINGEEYATGDLLRIRFAEIVGSTSFHTAEADNVAVSASGWSAVLSPQAEPVYATNAKDGSTFTQFALDLNDDDINVIADTDFAGTELFAWYCYSLTDDNGMHNFYGAFTAVDEANYRANTSIANILLDETVGAFVKQTDVARIYRDDGARPTKDPTTGGYGIAVNYYARSFPYDAGGGGFTAADRSDIVAIKGKTDSLNFTEPGNVDANIQYVNDVEVTGTGQSGDEWGP